MKHEIFISEEHIGKRFDQAISELYDRSRTYIQTLIKSGNIMVNGQVLKSASKKVSEYCKIEITDSDQDDEPYKIDPENIPLDILYEDEYIVVLNKPTGMVCHPAPGHRSGTLVNALVYHFENSLSDISGFTRPGIIHRLDKDTSGVMIIAKSNQAHEAFAKMFETGKGSSIRRKYLAYVYGIPLEKSGRIETHLTRHPKNRQAYTVSDSFGKFAITLYETVGTKYFTSTKSISKVRCELLTGRTHQIRVHMKHIGNHIIGDQTYGKTRIETSYPDVIRNFPRQALHSSNLSFVHPFTNEHFEFVAQLPEDIKDIDEFFNRL